MPIYELECDKCKVKEEVMCSYSELLKILTFQDCEACGGRLLKCVSKPAQAQWAGDKSFSVTGGKGTKE